MTHSEVYRELKRNLVRAGALIAAAIDRLQAYK